MSSVERDMTRRLVTSIAISALLAVPGCAGGARPGAGTPSRGATPTSSGPAATPTPTGTHGRQPADPSPTSATLIAFVLVGSGGSGDAAGEVTAPEQFDRFLAGSPAIERVREATERHRRAGVRLFAFVVNGCQNDAASLVIQPARVYATLTGGAGIQCFVAEQYLAVFAVPAGLVPDGARVG
jgi:hypothetical protein